MQSDIRGSMFSIDKDIEKLIVASKTIDDRKDLYDAPLPGCRINIGLIAPSIPSTKFFLDVSEGARSSCISLSIASDRKTTMQTRQSSIPLVRVDIDQKAAHTNPNGSVVKGSHIHIATIDYGDRLAFPLDQQMIIPGITASDTVPEIFEKFRAFCGIEDSLNMKWNLGV